MNELYYFGCIRQVGHFLFQSDNGRAVACHYAPRPFANRFGYNGERLDGMFCPPATWGTQVWMESNVGKWRIISWCDNSVDSRTGSHSTFIGYDYSTAEALLEDAKLRFSEVFARQPQVRKGEA